MKVVCENTLCRFNAPGELCGKDRITLVIPGHYDPEESLTMDCIDFEYIDGEDDNETDS